MALEYVYRKGDSKFVNTGRKLSVWHVVLAASSMFDVPSHREQWAGSLLWCFLGAAALRMFGPLSVVLGGGASNGDGPRAFCCSKAVAVTEVKLLGGIDMLGIVLGSG
eukprot:CAMPEP_0172664110 /NCGR_PEP_ID=MMETSP1074-20121228/6374_1 /TAXON_ID=2916 /ORGANISM="Ceratium fusus, Strain PA161109" /LENGTH=107 /DNA_ID=CAMNT_0013480203 /DNA_START=175 /DNA_END=498 /DNA_ORIENTATION=-